jgi:hypothetical protein
MTKRVRRNHSPAFKAKVALGAAGVFGSEAEAGGRRRSPRTRKGAVSQSGTVARNSLSRMPGSWSGIADPAGYEVGREPPVFKNRSSPETGNRSLTSMPSYEGIGRADVARSRRRGVIVAPDSDEAASNFQLTDNADPPALRRR